MKINTTASFGASELSIQRNATKCPVKGCNSEHINEVKKTKSGKIRQVFYCPQHGLEIRPDTFIYYNGASNEERRQAKLRNLLPALREFSGLWILGNKNKAESHRLGYENSEDALSLNIFGWLHLNKQLPCIYQRWTGVKVHHDQLKLFLWGMEIDFSGKPLEVWGPLQQVRESLESDVGRFKTEPDIMILGPTHLVCIEAKFTSGNPLCVEKSNKPGEKPKSVELHKERYIISNNLWQKPVLTPDDIVGCKIHSQLLRMIVFTSTMTQLYNNKLDWCVVNLVSQTQWNKRISPQCGYDFHDPSDYIPANIRNHFHFDTWERLYAGVLDDQPGFETLAKYMKTKTANLQPAFNLPKEHFIP